MQVLLSLGFGNTDTTLNVFYILLADSSTFSLDFDGITIDAVVDGESALYGIPLQNGPQKV